MLDKKNFYIDGKWVSPADLRNYKVIDPSNEEPCAEISLGGKKDVDKAVSAAKKAFETWAFTKKEERLELLEKLYVIYKKRWAEMAKLITLEMGAPMKFSTEMQAATGAGHIKSFKQILKDFIYTDSLNLNDKNTEVPIGVNCRTCDRMDCQQRAFPPLHKKFDIDLNKRGISVYVAD